MLSDLLISLFTSAPPHLRALGYLDEALALRRRHRRNREAWQPHLDRTRAFILDAAERCRKRDRVVLLGSGLLLDVPLPELARSFREVVLQDVVCLPEARKKLRRNRNARFVQQDVTNIAALLVRNAQQGLRTLPESLPLPLEGQADLVVSLNILSQLWVIPRAFAAGRLRGLPEDVIDDWCGRIVEAHYRWLRSLPCDVCLVADHEVVKRDAAGGVISRGSTICNLRLPPPEQEWTWQIAPPDRRRPQGSKELIVGAWRFGREQR